ncbi:MAG TPA: histidine kinase N-terminal 7TM domain-containing protein, partial [Armatimonadota bacterium]
LDPTSGNVSIEGQSIITRRNAVQRMIGVCPQENILWDKLTCLEQLEFIGVKFWFKFQAVWKLPAATAVFWFALEYCNLNRWLTRRIAVLLALGPLLLFLLILTNDAHHLIWRGFSFDRGVQAQFGLVNWIVTGYGYALAVIGVIVFLGLFIRSPQHRMPAMLILLGMVAPRVTFALDTLHLIPVEPIDPTVLVFIFTATMYATALFRFRLFHLVPIAHETVLAQMREGMLVLDRQRRIVDLNPAAEQILDASAGRVRGHPVQVLTAYADLTPLLDAAGQGVAAQSQRDAAQSQRDAAQSNPDVSRSEVTLSRAHATRHYVLEHSPIRDQRGLPLGDLVLFHDVTEQRQAQTRLVEQQRVVASLQERERLARELHDTLVQTTAAIRMQADTANALMDRGDTELLRAALTRLSALAQDVHSDLREFIFGSTVTAGGRPGFYEAVRRYLARFTQTWSVQTDLRVSPLLEQGELSITVQAQLWRIIQEALANTRKHAAAQHVLVAFETDASDPRLLTLVIEDDGCGFDSTQFAVSDEHGFGISSMRARAQTIGCTFEIASVPGKGTRVWVKVPQDN